MGPPKQDGFLVLHTREEAHTILPQVLGTATLHWEAVLSAFSSVVTNLDMFEKFPPFRTHVGNSVGLS